MFATKWPKAVWRGDARTYGGRLTGKPRVMVWHTTETVGLPGYGGGVTAPTFSAGVRTRTWYQHAPIGSVVGTLKGWSSSGGPTNHANVIAQVEIIAYSSKTLGTSIPGGRWVGAFTDSDLAWLAELPKFLIEQGWLTHAAWSPGWSGTPSINEMSWDEWWYRRSGAWTMTGHDQNPDASNHWDPGALDRVRLVELAGGAQPEEDSMFCSYGDRNGIVETWQRTMNRLGYQPALDPDGAYGPATKAAVAALCGTTGSEIGPTEVSVLVSAGGGGPHSHTYMGTTDIGG